MTALTPDDLAALAATWNACPATAERAARHGALVSDTNTRIAAAADAMLAIDSSPTSFAALKAAFAPPTEEER